MCPRWMVYLSRAVFTTAAVTALIVEFYARLFLAPFARAHDMFYIFLLGIIVAALTGWTAKLFVDHLLVVLAVRMHYQHPRIKHETPSWIGFKAGVLVGMTVWLVAYGIQIYLMPPTFFLYHDPILSLFLGIIVGFFEGVRVYHRSHAARSVAA